MDVLKSYYEISPFFFLITASSSFLYLTMNLISIISGFDGDGILDDHHHVSSDATFKFFSMQTILAFFMGFGWAGITATTQWFQPFWLACIYASGCGLALMTFTAWLMKKVKSLNHIPAGPNLYATLGSKGTVYSTIPASGGEGKVQIIVSGSLKIVTAVSADDSIDSFAEIEVIGVKDKDTLIVKKFVKDTSNGESA